MCVYTVYECVCWCVCVCCATLFSARQDGWEQRNIACHCWMTEPFQPPPLNAKDQTTDGSQRCVMEVEDVNSGLGQWAVGMCVCICVSFFFFVLTCFHPGFGICQLRTNGGIFVGVKSGRVPRQHRYQQQGWLSFRGHKQDSVCAHNNVGQVLRRPSSQQHPVISRKWNLHPCPLVFFLFFFNEFQPTMKSY